MQINIVERYLIDERKIEMLLRRHQW